ncbi:GNAT family N-acetyltransferase [Halorarius halobius]|uniref:GNAT family N-acetyltransferase n=1 Tax=Halorarius halobius TaxID=2962671 RepID=UPI0020CDF724|nr:GNAT family protein [Halorarius halobius]
MPGPVFLDGDRIDLRTLEREDLELVQRSRNDPAIRERMTFTDPASMDDVEEFYENVVLGDDNLNLVVCVDGEPAGTVVLFDVGRHSAELAAWLLPEYQGDGYGTEAAELLVGHGFEGLGLHRIRGKALRDNDASRATMESLGFREVGVARDAVFQRGQYQDMVRYDILAADWFDPT